MSINNHYLNQYFYCVAHLPATGPATFRAHALFQRIEIEDNFSDFRELAYDAISKRQREGVRATTGCLLTFVLCMGLLIEAFSTFVGNVEILVLYPVVFHALKDVLLFK